MKKIAILLIFALMAFGCFAMPSDVEVEYSGMIPQILTWDDSDVDAEGNPLIEGDVITWELFYCPAPFNSDNAVSISVVEYNEATVDLSALTRGWYYVGVRSIGTDADLNVNVSGILWSNDPVRLGPIPAFAYRVTGDLIPAFPQGFQPVSP